MNRERVAITGVGIVSAAVVGQSAALGAFLAAPRAVARDGSTASVPGGALASLIEPGEVRRLSRACQLSIAAARLALREAAYDPAFGLGLAIGTEFGDLRSTIEFADGYLHRGPAGLSALLFPNTVMNTMAATTAIALGAREVALTFNTPTVAGELAVARAAAAVASGRVPAMLAGGIDDLDSMVLEALADFGLGTDRRGDGAAYLVLEPLRTAVARGATLLGEISGAAWRALPARPFGVGRAATPRAVSAALASAECAAADVGWVYGSASGDRARDDWERAILDAAFGARRPPTASLADLVGHHSGLGALRVACGAWTARSGLLPGVTGGALARVRRGRGLVHGIARGGTHVALVVGATEHAA